MRLLFILLFAIHLFAISSCQELAAQTHSLSGRDLAVANTDSTALYVNVQQQHSSFAGNMNLNQSSVGIKLKKTQYTLLSNLQRAYNSTKAGWQLSNELYYTPKEKKTYQYASLSVSNGKWFPHFMGAVSNYYIGIRQLEIENGVKYIALSGQKDIWMINTGGSYALDKNLFLVRWTYLNNGVSNNDFIVGYRYYFNQNTVAALNLLSGDNNVIPEYNNLPTAIHKQYQTYYGFNLNTSFPVFKNTYLGANYTYNHFTASNNTSSWNLHIASLSLTYKLF